MKSKKLSVDLQDRIVSSGEGYRKISAALKVPMTIMASIINKWKKFGTQGGDQEPDCHCQSSSISLWREPSRRTTIYAALQSGLYGRVARRKPLLSKRHICAHLEFAKRQLKDSQTTNKILWSDETKIELYGLNWQASCLKKTRHRSSPGQYHP
ncbi:hypothetical protein UPYG_G00026440 [Umbra pygmaea]|uniref:Sleeping Beauty transposase HTH domain-containing protein n=1 Tax=Umbra pygmaea TaxID=75934 RepID=A0ABD0XLW6_UMBPY